MKYLLFREDFQPIEFDIDDFRIDDGILLLYKNEDTIAVYKEWYSLVRKDKWNGYSNG